jgi:hypothetical protein
LYSEDVERDGEGEEWAWGIMGEEREVDGEVWCRRMPTLSFGHALVGVYAGARFYDLAEAVRC